MGSSAMRTVFEARARALHIPYTHLTSDGDLAAQVLAQERADLRLVGAPPPCFGVFWEGQLGEDCAQCAVQCACLHQFAGHTLPRAQDRLRTFDNEELAAELSVAAGAVVLARMYASELPGQQGGAPSPQKESPAASPKPAQTPPPPPRSAPPKIHPPPPSSCPPASVPPVAAAASSDASSTATPAAALDASAQPTCPTVNLLPTSTPETAPTPSTIDAPKTPKTPPAPKPAKTPKKKQTKKKKGPALVSPKMSRTDPRYQPWGEHTYMTRWLRERQKNPVLAEIRPGQVLRRMYQGTEIQVRVKEGYYEYQTRRYATLYAIVKEVTGAKSYPKSPVQGQRPEGSRQITNWSATRFFRVAVREAADRCCSISPP